MKKNLFLISLVGLNLLVMLSYAFLYVTVSRSSAAVSQARAAFFIAEKKEEELTNIKRNLAEKEEERSKVESYFVRKSGLTTFIERLEGLAKEAAVELTLNSVDLGEGSAGGQFGELTLSYQATGGFANLYNFLGATENLPLKLKVIKTDLNHAGDPKKLESLWKGSFTLKVLSFIND